MDGKVNSGITKRMSYHGIHTQLSGGTKGKAVRYDVMNRIAKS